MITAFFTAIFYQPLFNLFVELYNVIPGHDAGLVIIVITLAVRGLLYPLYRRQVLAQKAMQDMQPRLEEIRKTYAEDKEGQAKAMMALYKEHKMNPLSSCLPLIIQLPIFISVYAVLRDGLTKPDSLNLLYSFVQRPDMIQHVFLGFLDLSKPSYVLAVAAAAVQFWQAKMLFAKRVDPAVRKNPDAKDEDMMAMMNKQMLYMMPIMIGIIGLTLPSGLSLYWFVSTLCMVAQQYIAFASHKRGTTKVDEKTEVIAK